MTMVMMKRMMMTTMIVMMMIVIATAQKIDYGEADVFRFNLDCRQYAIALPPYVMMMIIIIIQHLTFAGPRQPLIPLQLNNVTATTDEQKEGRNGYI